MTLPQDTRAPHRQQRWIELQNFGSTPIPPFGALEIVQSTRPELGGYTPLDGRTVLQVRRSLKDNPCGTVINGPCEILNGLSGRVGTMDDPMLALVAEEYDPGTVVGVKAGSFLLEKGYCGYLILGDYDIISGTMRVKRWEDCPQELMVRAVECIYPGDMDKAAQPQKWNASTRCWVDDPDAHQIYICDCNKWLLAVPGECFKVERNDICSSDTSVCYRPSFPYGLTRRVRIENPIYPNQCGDAKILEDPQGTCYPTPTICEIRVCNTSKRKIACDANEDATLHITPGRCGDGSKPDCYGWLVPDCRPLRATAKVGNPVCGGGEAQISEVVYKDVCNWEPREDPTTALVPVAMYVCADRIVELGWNDCACKWEITGVPDEPMPETIMDLRCGSGDCVLEKQVPLTQAYGHYCDCSQAWTWETVLTGTRVTFVTDIEDGLEANKEELGTVLTGVSTDSGESGADKCEIDFTGQKLTAIPTIIKRKSYCVFCATEGATETLEGPPNISLGSNAPISPIQFTKVEPVTEADFNCDSCPSLAVKTTAMFALCVEAEGSADTVSCVCEPCEEASNTPSSTPSATGT